MSANFRNDVPKDTAKTEVTDRRETSRNELLERFAALASLSALNRAEARQIHLEYIACLSLLESLPKPVGRPFISE